jgi:hypothetical protein
MDYRRTEIATTLKRWLDRYSPPAAMKDKPQAMADEIDAMMRQLLRFAPQTGYGDFVAEVLERVEAGMRTRAWPTVGEVGVVAGAMRKERGGENRVADATVAFDEYEIAAKKMRAGDAVGQQYIYGPKAKELEARGFVDDATFRKYRSSLFFSLRGMYGGDRAVAMEDELIRDHTASARPTSPEELAEMREAKFKRMGE